MEGLEAMQLYPHDSGSEVFVGIGDWFGQSATPDERLDVGPHDHDPQAGAGL
ncbi:MAG: hypothetical protein IPM68_03920 [Flavobacteriales bacterium]|nr:hypothetical protein [Flavobacteriales bacterium]